MRRWKIALGTLLLIPVLSAAVMACPMCKDSIPGATGETGDPSQMSGGALPGGFNTSVYLMLVGFMGTLGMISFVVVKGIRGADQIRGFPVVPNRGEEKTDEKPVEKPESQI
jgi:hypothetical protein